MFQYSVSTSAYHARAQAITIMINNVTRLPDDSVDWPWIYANVPQLGALVTALTEVL